jgi:ribosomal protein S18 acetylase RimI-like enzyme
VLYRRANENDIFELLRIEDECFGAERFSTEIVRAFIVRADAFTVVAEDERAGRLVGSASCLISEDTGEGRIASIAVIRNHREQGIGSGLLTECEKTFGTFRLRRFVLEVETTNLPAILMYAHRGYTVKGLLKDYYGYGRDGYFMERRLCRDSRRLKVR